MATIKKIYNPALKSPFQVTWSIDGKRFSRFFGSEEEQDEFVRSISPHIVGDSMDILKLDLPTIREVLFVDKTRGDVSFRSLWDFWQKHHKVRETVTLFNAADVYVRSIIDDGQITMEHINHVRRMLERLCYIYGDSLLEEITRDDLEEFISGLPFSPVTKKNYRSCFSAAWGWFERKGWIEKNVASRLKAEKIIRGEVEFLRPEEAEQLMRANEKVDPEICGLLALGLFAGMRSSAIPRVEYHEIKFEDKGIETPAEKTKKRRRNYIQGLPDNLWAWLKRTPKSAFGWNERKFEKRKQMAMQRAGLLVNAADVKKLKEKGIKAKLKLPPHNAMRHSFVSYHVAKYKEFQRTALIISHKGTDVLFEHYCGAAKEADAEKYFNIYPTPKA